MKARGQPLNHAGQYYGINRTVKGELKEGCIAFRHKNIDDQARFETVCLDVNYTANRCMPVLFISNMDRSGWNNGCTVP